MRRSFKFVLALAGTIALASHANAARLYFTTSGAIPDGGAPKAGVPEINLSPGETTDLYVWVDLKGDVGGDGDDTFMAGYGVGIVATNPGVVEAVSSTLYNPEYTLPSFGGLASGVFRWSSPFRAPTINPDGAGGAMLARDAAGTYVNTNGAAGIGFSGAAVLAGQPSPPAFGPLLDPLYDATNGVFLAQHIQLRAADMVSGSQSTGIVIQIGANAFSLDNNANREDLFFGAGDVAVANNAVGSSDGTMHAMITVQGGVTRMELVIVNGDPTGAMNVPFEGRRPVNVPIGGPAAKLAIDNGFAGADSFFDVFFDVEIAGDSNTDLAGLMDMLTMQGFDVKSGRTLPTGPNREGMDYDFGIRLSDLGGGGQTILDVDFGANGVTGVTINNIAVPEPSSFILAGLGCVVVLGLRRRKSA